MMNVFPIPAELLPHTVTHDYGAPVAGDWGEASWPSTRQVSRVRIDELVASLDEAVDNTSRRAAAVMFYDCIHSSPASIVFEVGDRIVFDGADYRVSKVSRAYGLGILHHLEVELV